MDDGLIKEENKEYKTSGEIRIFLKEVNNAHDDKPENKFKCFPIIEFWFILLIQETISKHNWNRVKFKSISMDDYE